MLSFSVGWVQIIVRVCSEVDAVKRYRFDSYTFIWGDFKDKLRVARFDYREKRERMGF